ncbi:MAG: hypothetical protein PWR20_263 [Bacteroidales bacterium]|jgi:2-polyprenyl-3-methyl-5-hydroxy-6-metoxy-1,4-benzoquinol methylase|nr:hypothetical protein [Bacteroidales bacterium]MDN5328375.1 hypothetical protein [Bacteroidales bacterium]
MNCPICGSSKVYQVKQVKDFFLSGEEFKVMECENCAIGFTNPFPAIDNLARYYKSPEYFSHANKNSNFLFRIYNFIRSFNSRWKARQVERHVSKVGTILDIGCGSGAFLLEMKKRGWNCQGVELDSESREFVKNTLGVNVVRDISEIDKAVRYDVITLWHVLEHFYNPKELIQELKNYLKDNGLLIVAVPNRDSLDAHYFGAYWAAYDVPRHLFHFNSDSLRSLLESAGFTIIKAKPLAIDVLYVSYLSYRYLKKWLALVHGTLKGLFFLLWSRKLSDYSSIVLFVRKN